MNRILSCFALVALALGATAQVGGGGGTLPTLEFYGSLSHGVPGEEAWAPMQGIDLPWGTYYAASAAIDPNAPVMSTSWLTGNGTVCVTTPKLVGESTGNQAWMHRAAVNAVLNDPGMQSLGLAGVPGQFEAQGGGSTLTTTWNSNPPPLTHTVSTPAIEGETMQEQVARHQIGVNALSNVFPPVKGERTGTPAGKPGSTSWAVPAGPRRCAA